MAEHLSSSSAVSVVNLWNRTFEKSEQLRQKNPLKIKVTPISSLSNFKVLS